MDMTTKLFETQNKIKSLKTEGGILDHAQIACNGDVLLLHFLSDTFFFNVKSG